MGSLGFYRFLRESISCWACIWDGFCFQFSGVDRLSNLGHTHAFSWLWCPHQRYRDLEESPPTQETWLSSICRCCNHGRGAQGRQNSEEQGESSLPKPLPKPKPFQCPMPQPSKITSQSIIQTSFLSGLSSRRCNIHPLEPQDPLWGIVYSHFPEPHECLWWTHYVCGIQCKPRPSWALTCPILVNTECYIYIKKRLDLFWKWLLHGYSFSSCKAAQQLWGEEWSPKIIGSSS